MGSGASGASGASGSSGSSSLNTQSVDELLSSVKTESNLKLVKSVNSVFDIDSTNDQKTSTASTDNAENIITKENISVSLYGNDPSNNYKTLSKLGDGAFSVVHKAVNTNNEKKFFAIKTCDIKKLAASQLEDLKLEVCILSRCKHPAIVELYSVHVTPSKVFLVMEYLEGGELLNAICRKQRYAENDARIVMYQVASAIDYLHSKKIIHRDIKPENLILAKRNVDTSVKLVDFGFAIVHEDNGGSMKMNYKCGTYGYMAPEVMESNVYSTSCDIWSFGVVCYVIQCGHMPFPSKNQTKSTIPYEFPKQTWKNISDSSKDLICNLLQTDPKKRLTSSELLQDEWFNFKNELSNYDNLTENLDSIRKYHALRRFRMSVIVVMVAKKLLKSIHKSDEDMINRMKDLVTHRFYFADNDNNNNEDDSGHMNDTFNDEGVKSEIRDNVARAASTIKEGENESLTPKTLSLNDFDTLANDNTNNIVVTTNVNDNTNSNNTN